MNLPDLVSFLQQKTCLSILSTDILTAIASNLSEQTIVPQQTIIIENAAPDALYIVQSGRLASNSILESNQSSLLSGTVLNLYALLLDQPTQYQVETITEVQVWLINRERFQALIQEYPQISQAFSQQLASQVKELSAQLQFEQERQVILRPYLVSKAKRGVIGKSRYATRLRSQIKQAAQTRESVLIFGEPGLEKDNLAALIHFGSANRRQPIIKIDCSKLQTSGAELFGRSGGKPGLIASLQGGTLVLNNIHLLPAELIPAIADLIKTAQYTPIMRPGGETSEPKTSQARIILISEQTVAAIDSVVDSLIKVPPLRVRKTDLDEQINYYLNLIGRDKRLRKTQITPEAIRNLQAYDFPNNLRELEKHY